MNDDFKTRLYNVFLWWAIIGYSLWIGGTLFSMVVIVPMWSSSPPDSVIRFFTGTSFSSVIYNFFGPPWMLLRVVPLFLALFLGWKKKQRTMLLVACGCMMAIIIYTIVYIYPINLLLMEQTNFITDDQIVILTCRWIEADRIRYLVGCIGYLFLLRAFQLSGPTS